MDLSANEVKGKEGRSAKGDEDLTGGKSIIISICYINDEIYCIEKNKKYKAKLFINI